MKKMRWTLCVLSAVSMLAAVPMASGGLTAGGLQAFLDFTKPPNSGGTGAGGVYVDKTGNGNNAVLQFNTAQTTGAYYDATRPAPFGPAVGFNGGWVDIVPQSNLTSLTQGTIEFWMTQPYGDNAPMWSAVGLQASRVLDDGFANGWETWHDKGGATRWAIGGRTNGVDDFGVLRNHEYYTENREQWIVRFDGSNVEISARLYDNGTSQAECAPECSLANTGFYTDTTSAGGVQFLQDMQLLRLGARNNESETGGDPHAIQPAASRLELFRVYDRVLSDAEIDANYVAFNTPEPSSLLLTIAGATMMLRRRRARQR